MKSRSNSFLRMAVILLASATLGLAQTSGYENNQVQYGNRPAQNSSAQSSSVQPGAVNYIEGQVSADGQSLDQRAVGHLTLQKGQTLSTGNGYAEVLLTPGTFLRVGNNSEFRLENAGLADTKIELTHGQALLEVDQIITGTQLSVGIGNNTADVMKKGLYNFDANQQAVRVLDGKVKVVSGTKSREIGKDDQVLLTNGDNLKKSDFSASQMKADPLYVWSEARSRQESGANQLAAENSSGYVPAGTGWFWDPYVNYYGFWPTSAYLYSPFGFGFYGGYYPGVYGGYYPLFLRGGYYRGGAYYHGYSGIRYARPSGAVGNYSHSFSGGYSHMSGGFGGGGFHGGGHR